MFNNLGTYGLRTEKEEDKDWSGLEFLLRNKFILKACDFLLGKKSPLYTSADQRVEMGGSYSSPNFSPLINLITEAITSKLID
jgi:hypothetical protein